MSSLDIFLLLCILIVSAYTYTKRNIKIIETFVAKSINTTNNTNNRTIERLESVELKTNQNRNLINYLNRVLGFKETKNKKSLFERIVVLEEELSEDDEGGSDNYEYELPEP